jgi:FkbM family methyltransferase
MIISSFKKIFWNLFTAIDARLKFPALKKGEIGIQAGFDMSAPVTSDLFLMHTRVKNDGLVIGIDPDPENHRIANEIIERKKLNIKLVQKALYSTTGESIFYFGEKASWNQLGNIALDSTVSLKKEGSKVELETLDQIISYLQIDINKIGHINLTINGAEYAALKGMHKILSDSKNLALTIIAGRYDDSGTIDGRPDHELIIELLNQYGFKYKFRRINQFFWWGFIVNVLIRRKWIYNKKNYGVIMAVKGNKRIKWYQSFS